MNFEESAKSRGLRGNRVTWVRGSVGCVGQIFTRVAWVTRVKIFFTWVIIFAWVAWVKYVFAWVFAWIKIFCVGLFFPCVSFCLIDQIILLY